jgi:hypothetical protein
VTEQFCDYLPFKIQNKKLQYECVIFSLKDWSINKSAGASVCYVPLIIQDEKLDYFYIHHFKEACVAKCCI